jgi:hypothetical protein
VLEKRLQPAYAAPRGKTNPKLTNQTFSGGGNLDCCRDGACCHILRDPTIDPYLKMSDIVGVIEDWENTDAV